MKIKKPAFADSFINNGDRDGHGYKRDDASDDDNENVRQFLLLPGFAPLRYQT